MVRSILEQLRTLLIVWLLLTVPVVCHHETAVTIVGALAGVRPHGAAAVAAAHMHAGAGALLAHGDHDAVSTDPATDLLAISQPTGHTGRWWCSHHASTGVGLLPDGLDSSALLVRPPVASLAAPSVSAAGAETVLPSSHASPPPAPPPRPALV